MEDIFSSVGVFFREVFPCNIFSPRNQSVGLFFLKTPISFLKSQMVGPLACMLSFPISDHVMRPKVTVSFKSCSMHVEVCVYVCIIHKKAKGKFPLK